MSVSAVAAFGGESFGRLPTAFQESPNVRLFSLHHDFFIGNPADLHDRGKVHPGPGVDIISPVLRIDERMVGLGFSEGGQSRPVEVDPIIVNEIWILAGIHAACLEPNLAGGFIHLVDPPDNPLALRDLVFDRARLAVEKVKMIPAVPLRHPNNLFPVGEVKTIFLARIAEERRRLLADDGPRLACRAVDFDDPVNLVPPLVVFEGERPAVLPPDRRRNIIGAGKERAIDIDLLFCLDKK